MLKRLKTVSMMLFLMGNSTGAAFAISAPGADDVKITQQSETATGTVVDAMGPVIGASVVVKGTTNGTITDFDGNFSLSGVKKGAILEISFIGYATKEVVWEGKALNVTLEEDTQQLEEVVVTALGIKREKKALGYACLYKVQWSWKDSRQVCRWKGTLQPHTGQRPEGRGPGTACTHISCQGSQDGRWPSRDGIPEQISLRRSQGESLGPDRGNT